MGSNKEYWGGMGRDGERQGAREAMGGYVERWGAMGSDGKR